MTSYILSALSVILLELGRSYILGTSPPRSSFLDDCLHSHSLGDCGNSIICGCCFGNDVESKAVEGMVDVYLVF